MGEIVEGVFHTPVVDESVQSLVEICEGLLADAKNGDLLALAVATICSRETDTITKITAGSAWGGDERFYKPLGESIKRLDKRFGKESRKLIVQ